MSELSKDGQEDIRLARESLRDLMEKGRGSLDEMLEVANQAEHPRAYEVVSKMIKDLSDVADRLIDLNKKEQEIKNPRIPAFNPMNPGLPDKEGSDQIAFMGSTSELMRLLKQEQQAAEKEVNTIDGESTDVTDSD